MAHCAGCDDPNCQGVVDITIPKEEFERIIYYLKNGIDDPTNRAKMALTKAWLKTLGEYDVEAYKKVDQELADRDRVDCFGNRY
jgi:hypothetical protein